MTSIKLKKSSVAGKIPTDSDLAHGELAINFQDGKLFYKDASNNVKAFIDSAAVDSLITAKQGLDSDGVKSVHFGDNEKLTFGNDSDFKIFHDGTRTILHDEGTGEIQVRTSQFRIRNPGNTETLAKFVQDGAVELFHGMSGSAAEKKLETTSTGVDVTGKLIADSAELSGRLRLPQIGRALEFGASAGGGGTNAIDMNNCNIIGINRLVFNDPGAGEGLQFDNIKLFESPDDQSNAAGSLQVTYNNARIFTVSDSGVNITGNLRINDAPADFGLDSTNVINLIDSDYVLNRSGISIPVLSEDSSLAFNQRLSFQAQTTSGVLEVQPRMSVLDSAGTETLVNVNFVGGGGTDSAAVIALIDSAYVQARQAPGTDSSATIALMNAAGLQVPDGGSNHDSAKISLGNDSDLKIFHNGSHSVIQDAGTGSLLVQSNNFTVQNATGTENQITALSGGAVALYHNDSAKLTTTAYGATVTGTINADSATFSGNANFNGNATFSSGSQILTTCNGSVAAISVRGGGPNFMEFLDGTSTTNAIAIAYRTTPHDLRIERRQNANIIAEFGGDDGHAALFYDNSKKLETTDSGVTVTGELTADSATFTSALRVGNIQFPTVLGGAGTVLKVQGGALAFGTGATGNLDSAGAVSVINANGIALPDNIKATFGNDSDLKIFHDGSNSIISEGGTGSLKLRGSAVQLTSVGGEIFLNADVNDGVDLYFDNSKKFETTTYGATVTGTVNADSATISQISIPDGTSTTNRLNIGNSDDLILYHQAGVGNIIRSNVSNPIYLQTNHASGFIFGKVGAAEEIARFKPDAEVSLRYNNTIRFETLDSGVNITGNLRVNNALFTSTDSAVVTGIVDSAYVQARSASGVTGSINNVQADRRVGDASNKTFALSVQPADSDDVMVFVNGVLQHTNTYSLSGQNIILDSAPDSASEIEFRTHSLKSTSLSLRDYKSYIYTLGSTLDSVSGADSGGTTLTYDPGFVDVYANGAKLVTGKDYTANTGNKIVFDSAFSSGNIIEVVSHAKAKRLDDGIFSVDSSYTTTSANQLLHIFPTTLSRSVKYVATLSHASSGSYHSEEILLVHNGTTVAMTTYAQVLLDSNLGTFDADINSGNVRLKITPAKTNTAVKLRAIRTPV